MSNSEKSRHGLTFHESIKDKIEQIENWAEGEKEKLIKNYEYRKYYGIDGLDPKQFYVTFEITFPDDSAWAVYTTTELNDRFKTHLWNAEHVKKLNERIEYAMLVYPDSVSAEKERAFIDRANSITSDVYYSTIDFIFSETDFKLHLLEKGTATANYSSGKKGDFMGKRFEWDVVAAMNNEGNLSRLKKGSLGSESGCEYKLFKMVVGAFISDADVKSIASINAKYEGDKKTKVDVRVFYQMTDGRMLEQKISCKQTCLNQVAVHQCKADDMIKVIRIDSESEFAEAIRKYQECGSKKRLEEVYGLSESRRITERIEQGFNGTLRKTFVKWAVSGYAEGCLDSDCADYILIRTYKTTKTFGESHDVNDQIFTTETLVETLLEESSGQMNTPFSWTYTGKRGRSIQLKMKSKH